MSSIGYPATISRIFVSSSFFSSTSRILSRSSRHLGNKLIVQSMIVRTKNSWLFRHRRLGTFKNNLCSLGILLRKRLLSNTDRSAVNIAPRKIAPTSDARRAYCWGKENQAPVSQGCSQTCETSARTSPQRHRSNRFKPDMQLRGTRTNIINRTPMSTRRRCYF